MRCKMSIYARSIPFPTPSSSDSTITNNSRGTTTSTTPPRRTPHATPSPRSYSPTALHPAAHPPLPPRQPRPHPPRARLPPRNTCGLRSEGGARTTASGCLFPPAVRGPDRIIGAHNTGSGAQAPLFLLPLPVFSVPLFTHLFSSIECAHAASVAAPSRSSIV